MKINSPNKKLSFFLALSVSFHLLVILFLIISKGLPYLLKKDKKLLIQNAIRIDDIDLPDLPSKLKAEKAKQKTVLVKKKKPIQKKRKKNTVKKKKKEKNTKEKYSEKKEKDSKNTNTGKNEQLNKGNKLSQGTKEGTESLTAQQLSEISIYASQIDSQIRTQWNLPKYLTDKNLTSQVEIRINRQGHIIYKKTLVSSGNDSFDSSVLKAIANAEPYPEPPANIQNAIKDGIVLTLSSRN